MAVALADVLRKRGTAPGAAALAAETGIAVFKVAFERWITSSGAPPMSPFITQSFDELRELAALSSTETSREISRATEKPHQKERSA
jgi:hypothetical protein